MQINPTCQEKVGMTKKKAYERNQKLEIASLPFLEMKVGYVFLGWTEEGGFFLSRVTSLSTIMGTPHPEQTEASGPLLPTIHDNLKASPLKVTSKHLCVPSASFSRRRNEERRREMILSRQEDSQGLSSRGLSSRGLRLGPECGPCDFR